MILAGLCDLLDGPVARLQKRVSLFGGFLDSILDRYADLILFLGLLVYYAHVNRFRYAVLAGAAMAGAVMVSYAKARANSLVPASEIGFWDRPERLVLMIVGALTESQWSRALDSRHRPQHHRDSPHRAHLEANRRPSRKSRTAPARGTRSSRTRSKSTISRKSETVVCAFSQRPAAAGAKSRLATFCLPSHHKRSRG